MINAMFPKRTRTQIKNKFKREERHNHLKVDAAISEYSSQIQAVYKYNMVILREVVKITGPSMLNA